MKVSSAAKISAVAAALVIGGCGFSPGQGGSTGNGGTTGNMGRGGFVLGGSTGTGSGGLTGSAGTGSGTMCGETVRQTTKLPPNILVPGHTYYARITAVQAPNTNINKAPYKRGNPNAFSDVLTATFSP